MDFEELKNKWIAFVVKMNDKGIPLPTVRDPDTGEGSIALTLVFISFNTCLISLMSKYAGYLGGIDISQSLNLFIACAALYWGKKFNKNAKGDISINQDSTEESVDKEEPK